jgi:hypothetical protein
MTGLHEMQSIEPFNKIKRNHIYKLIRAACNDRCGE